MLKKITLSFDDQTTAGTIKDVEAGAILVRNNIKTAMEELKAEHAKLQNEINELLLKLIRGGISSERYAQKQEELVAKRNEVMEEISELDAAADDHCELVTGLLEQFS